MPKPTHTASSPPQRGRFLRLPLSIRFLLFAIGILILNGFLLSRQTDQAIEQAFLGQADQKIHLLLDQIRRHMERGNLELTDHALASEVDYLNQHPEFGWQLHLTALYVFDANGRILAHSAQKDGTKRITPGSPYHRVIHLREASLGEIREYTPATDTVKGDYLLPMTLPDGRHAGIEVEVDITGLQDAISSFDGPFEYYPINYPRNRQQ
ncbi:PDC sensor domain-containing protein [Vreelandella rituensis]|uniref:Cache domain-containing protein n=1 Tax=Vreelandella rituensis TaxID=2282306 RepID=A0A368TSZ0_9GAMM|nr:PDC sensor domain-containing protein [Halomonas rituensis]RCV87232.1 hypothetical protein DU506_16960 [Halomonas rituensis]